MTLENIANEDLLLKFTNPPTGVPPTVPPDALYVGDQPLSTPPLTEVTTTLSTKCTTPIKKVATKQIVIAWTSAGCAFTSVTHTFVSGGGVVNATATKTTAENQLVLREGDVGSCAGSWTPPSGPAVVCACKVEISVAGQTKASAQ